MYSRYNWIVIGFFYTSILVEYTHAKHAYISTHLRLETIKKDSIETQKKLLLYVKPKDNE